MLCTYQITPEPEKPSLRTGDLWKLLEVVMDQLNPQKAMQFFLTMTSIVPNV